MLNVETVSSACVNIQPRPPYRVSSFRRTGPLRLPMNASSSIRPSVALVLSLLLLTVAYRLGSSRFEALGNTAPLMAIAFAGTLLLGRAGTSGRAGWWALWLPALLLVASDLALGWWHGGGGVGTYTLFSAVFYSAVALSAWALGSGGGRFWPLLWCGTLLWSLGFYLAANTFSWLASPAYAKTLAGWWQSQTFGIPGYPPTWMFLRNAILADTAWCALAGFAVWCEGAFARRGRPVEA